MSLVHRKVHGFETVNQIFTTLANNNVWNDVVLEDNELNTIKDVIKLDVVLA